MFNRAAMTVVSGLNLIEDRTEPLGVGLTVIAVSSFAVRLADNEVGGALTTRPMKLASPVTRKRVRLRSSVYQTCSGASILALQPNSLSEVRSCLIARWMVAADGRGPADITGSCHRHPRESHTSAPLP